MQVVTYYIIGISITKYTYVYRKSVIRSFRPVIVGNTKRLVKMKKKKKGKVLAIWQVPNCNGWLGRP